jgi:hypothetical protein
MLGDNGQSDHLYRIIKGNHANLENLRKALPLEKGKLFGTLIRAHEK